MNLFDAQLESSAPAPGLYRDVPFETYLRWPLLSQSSLKAGRRSMKHLRYALDETIEPTEEMTLGSALHTTFLEPEKALDRIAVWRGGRRVGAEFDAWEHEHRERIRLNLNQFERLQGMVRALRAHPEVRKWAGRIDGVEVAAVGDVHGVRMKSRCDALSVEPIVDLKKVSSNSFDPRRFERQAYDLGYHIQAYVYCQQFDRGRFMLVTVEDQPPHDVVPYEITPDLMRIGQQETMSLLQQYRQCVESGNWPGIADEPIGLDAPAWVAAEFAEPITFNGEVMT